MDVLLNEEEEMIRDGLRRFFEIECDTDRVRTIEDGKTRIDENLWQQLAELGWLGLALPAVHGGGEAPFTQVVLLFEEAGRALAPVPLHPHIVTSLALAQAIESGVGGAFGEEFILRACLGEIRLTWAWEERLPNMGPDAVSLRAIPDGNGWLLNGSKRMVEAFEISDYCLLAVRTDAT
ncbi:MAG: acyl-CoA dehydrogenase family protein, partial [Alphaproteobacteria bacterium]